MKKVILLNSIVLTIILSFVISTYGDVLKTTITNALVQMNLADKGIPFTISVPEGVVVKASSKVIDGDTHSNVSFKKDKFIMEVYTMGIKLDEDETLEDLVASGLRVTSSNDWFVKVVETFPGGYIYETKSDGVTGYDFHRIVIKDNQVYEFGLAFTIETFTLAEIKAMVAAAQSVK